MSNKKFTPYYQIGMFKGAPPESFAKAKELRSNLTAAEKVVWELLKKEHFKQYKFRRQHPVHLYIVDFYSHRLSLVIEIDGEYHNSKEQSEKDEQRTKDLNFQGLKLIRFTNKEVFEEIEKVENDILRNIIEILDSNN
nr:endonuclease domain-containing protein [uncultured Flavobacterium sp.]